MPYGLSGIADSYYANMYNTFRQNRVKENTTGGVSFLDAVSAKAAEKTGSMTFEEMLKSKYPNAYYNVMDTSKIDSGLWGRNDYPFDAYFKEPADASVLSWTPSGAEPPMNDPKVQSKIQSTLGKTSVVIPPALEEKMKNDPKLTEQVMRKVDEFISKYYRVGETQTLGGATYTTLDQGFLITFDENGEINHSCVTGASFSVSDSSFIEARKAREAKHAEYERIADENALRRKLQQQEIEDKYNKSKIAKEIVSTAYKTSVLT